MPLLCISSINISIFLVGTILSWLQFTSQYYWMADVWLIFEQAINTWDCHIPISPRREKEEGGIHTSLVVHLNCGPSLCLVRWIFKDSSFWTAYKILSLALNKNKSKPHSLQNKMWENTYCADTLYSAANSCCHN